MIRGFRLGSCCLIHVTLGMLISIHACESSLILDFIRKTTHNTTNPTAYSPPQRVGYLFTCPCGNHSIHTILLSSLFDTITISLDKMDFFSNSLYVWRTQTRHQTIVLYARILRSHSLKHDDVWRDVFALFFLCSFSGRYNSARDLLRAYFDAVPDFVPNPDLLDKQVLESIWVNAAVTRPANVPWTDGVPFNTTEYDIDDPAFYSMRWTDVKWRHSTSNVKDDTHIDPHSWKTTQDAYEHVNCARLLCRVPMGEVPDRAAISEALDALESVFALPEGGRGGPRSFGKNIPTPVYFTLAAGLGKLVPGKASEIFVLANKEGTLPDLIRIPALYKVFLGEHHSGESLVNGAKASAAANTITRALKERMAKGPQQPLHDVGWADLLRRFSEAAFKVHAEEYDELEDPPASASDILLPPITVQKLAEVEQRLGPLPADMKEMVQIANGFKGGIHAFGGGFAGVDKLHPKECGNLDEHYWLREDLDGRTPSKAAEEAPMWIGEGAVDNDEFEHYIYPPSTWSLLVGDGYGDGSGDYQVVYTANWMPYEKKGGNSMRDWIASETVNMEMQLAMEDSTEEWDEKQSK